MSMKNTLRLTSVVVALAGVAVYGMMRTSKQKDMSFRGEITYIEARQTGRNSYVTVLHIGGADGKEYEYELSVTEQEYFHYKDYVVKLPGKKKLALFRNRKQVRGYPFCLDEEVDMNKPVPGEVTAPPGGATAAQPGAPPMQPPALPPADAAMTGSVPPAPGANPAPAVAGPGPTAAPPAAPATEQQAQALLQEATRLWNDGNKAGAIQASEQAYEIRKQLYGENHPQTIDVKNRIAAARQAAGMTQP